MVTYRLIEQKDNSFLAKFIREVFIEHNAHHREGTIFYDQTTDNLHLLFQTNKSVCWIALVNNEIVGCCGIYPTTGLRKGYAELVKFYVGSTSRGKGIGKGLLDKCISSAIELGYHRLYLESLPEFDKAVGIYEHYGFHHLDGPLGNSGHFGCNIWMEKRIT